MSANKEQLVIEALVARGYLSESAVASMRNTMRAQKSGLCQVVYENKMMDQRMFARVVAEVIGLEYVALAAVKIEQVALSKVTAKFALHYSLVPVKYEHSVLTIAVSDPLDARMIDELHTLLVDTIKIAVATYDDIMAAIKERYGIGAETVQAMSEDQRSASTPASVSETTIDLDQDNSSIAKFVNQILSEAHALRATDIHLEPFENEFRVRYRIDGVLTDAPLPADVKRLQGSIITRVKIMASMDISEHRLPQDGRIKISSKGKEMDLRISVLPTPFGESVNIRLLSSNIALGLEGLGFSQDNLAVINDLIEKPHGIILLTGPTGSGKTTTLYACLNKVNNGKRKIITIEDPIEYQMKGITQIQVYPKIGLSFSQGLRSMLRHDPDIMMVGEIRDSETASIGMRVALTGHLVFSTLHTNDAPSAVTRLIDMGVEPYLVSSSMECIVAQRLVRTLCPRCKVEDVSSETMFKDSEEWSQWKGMRAFKAKGCEACRGTGYHGRTGIHEVMRISSEVRSQIARGHDLMAIREAARKAGMRTLREDGLAKVGLGITSMEEVVRATEIEM